MSISQIFARKVVQESYRTAGGMISADRKQMGHWRDGFWKIESEFRIQDSEDSLRIVHHVENSLCFTGKRNNEEEQKNRH